MGTNNGRPTNKDGNAGCSGALAAAAATNLIGGTKLLFGKLPGGAADIDLRDLEPPNSALAREAEAACAEQSDTFVGHSYRTWMYGTALAKLDRQELDPELFYCAALLHDWGLKSSIAGEDFTVRGAERALACAHLAGTDPARSSLLADGICSHATVGVTIKRDGALSYYVQHGAMADIAGVRIWDIAPANLQRARQRYPRDARKLLREGSTTFRNEALALPDGRFGLFWQRGGKYAAPLVERWAAPPTKGST